MLSTLQAPLPLLIYGAVVAAGAGAVRGFAGFGLSAFIVAAMSLWISPQQIVPAAMLLEALASLSLLRSIWRHIEWRWLGALVAGYAVAVPVGVWCLAVMPEVVLRGAVSAVILAAAVTLLSGYRPGWRDGIGLRVGTGLLAGFLSGLSSVGGMVVATMLFTTELPASRLRATLIALFFLSALYGLLWASERGLVTSAILGWVGWLVLPMFAGIFLGRRAFARASEADFRRGVLVVLATLATAGLVRALLSLV